MSSLSQVTDSAAPFLAPQPGDLTDRQIQPKINIESANGQISAQPPLNLALTDRAVSHNLAPGINSQNQTLEPNDIGKYSLLGTNIIALEQEKPSLETDQEMLKIASSFLDQIEIYCSDKLGITPQILNDIMGQEFIFSREANKSDGQKNFDYARHIALALNLAKFEEGNTEQNVAALLTVDLTKIESAEIKRHFEKQKQTVEKIRECKKKGESYLDLSNWSSDQIHALPPHIGQLEKLSELKLDKNQLTTLPAEIAALDKLDILRLEQNNLTLDEISSQSLKALSEKTIKCER